jgi:hypothetical protein
VYQHFKGSCYLGHYSNVGGSRIIESNTTRTADNTHRRKSAEWDGLLSFFYTVNSIFFVSKDGSAWKYTKFCILLGCVCSSVLHNYRSKEVGNESLCKNFNKNDKTVYKKFTILPET